MVGSRALAFVVKELKEVLPPTIFFGSASISSSSPRSSSLMTTWSASQNFMVAAAAALVVGKAVLLANLLPFLVASTLAPDSTNPVQERRLLRRLFCWYGRSRRSSNTSSVEEASAEFPTMSSITSPGTVRRIQIWVFVLFLIYTSITELSALFVRASSSGSSSPGVHWNRSRRTDNAFGGLSASRPMHLNESDPR